MKLRIYGELYPYIILLIIIGSLYFSQVNWEKYLIWKDFIDHIILLIFLVFMCMNSKKWNFYSQRILYSLFIIHFLNTYTILFGMPFDIYFNKYFLILIVTIYVTVVSISIKIIYKLYTLWKNGKIKFY